MDRKQKNNKNVVIAGTVIFVLIVVYALVSFIMTVGKVNVKVVYAPFAATVKIDGRILKNNANHYLSLGVHEVEVGFENFETFYKEVEVTTETRYLYASLNAINDEGVNYAKEHIEDFLAVEGIAGELENERGLQRREKLLKEAPVVAKLPVKNALFTIGYSDNTEDVKIIIDAPNTYMDEAVKKFKSLLNENERPSKYDIEFSGFDNLLLNNFEKNSEANPVDCLKTGFGKVPNFDITGGGESDGYYYAKVTTGTANTYSLVTYRLVLKQNANMWDLVAGPIPILTRYNVEDVPIEVIDAANRL